MAETDFTAVEIERKYLEDKLNVLIKIKKLYSAHQEAPTYCLKLFHCSFMYALIVSQSSIEISSKYTALPSSASFS